jgi:hypothetical protein
MLIDMIFIGLVILRWEKNETAPDGAPIFPEDHKIQTDKRARFSSGGACHGRAGCQSGSRSASGAISPIRSLSAGGAGRLGKPVNAAISGKSGAG